MRGHRECGHRRDRELGMTASSPAADWDAVTFLMSHRCREMKQEGEEMKVSSEMVQAERKCVRDMERHGETQRQGDPRV